jgi:MoaA/NifB/PqqE/SkfB family radical SAM enzyme
MTISTSGGKILSFYRDAQKLREGLMVAPRMVSLWLTTGCDLSCGYCWSHKQNREFRLANPESVRRLIDEIRQQGVEGLEFGGGGEPTLHPDCFDLACYAHDRGLRVGLLSNGYRFNTSQLAAFDYVRIGLDAPNPELYRIIKGGTPVRFRETLALIHNLLRERGAAPRPRIGIKYLICQENYLHIPEMVRLAQDLGADRGADYCQFKPVHSSRSGLQYLQALQANESIRNQQLECGSSFIYGTALREKKAMRCWLSPIHTVITPAGSCLVCCFFDAPALVVGNVFEQGFAAAWYSQRHWDVMAAIPEAECAGYDCRWHYYNREMAEILDEGKYDMAFI